MKIEKREFLRIILEMTEYLPNDFASGDLTKEELQDFVKQEIRSVEKKRVADKKRYKKIQQADDLKDRIYAFLSDNPVSIAMIVKYFDDENITAAKVASRLNKLYIEHKIQKKQIRLGKRRTMAYTKL